MTAIVELATFQTYARDDLAGADTGVLQTALTSAINAVNSHCNRLFTVAGAATTRVYVPVWGDVLDIHDCTTVTAVSNDGVAITSANYQLEPLNGINDAGVAVPYDRIVLTLGDRWVFDGKRATVSVTATWGWASIPTEVTEAVLMLAKDIAYNREQKGDVAGFGEFGAVRLRGNPLVQSLLTDYVKHSVLMR